MMAGGPQPGGRDRAPGALAHVQDFVNSVDHEHGHEAWPTPDALVGWFAARGLLEVGAPAGERDLERALAMREGLRAVLGAHNGRPADPVAVRALDAAAGSLALTVRFGAPSPTVAPGPALDGAERGLAGILAAAAAAAGSDAWARLKTCRNDGCQWSFYDGSRNRSGAWCAMRVCGARTKARVYRARHGG